VKLRSMQPNSQKKNVSKKWSKISDVYSRENSNIRLVTPKRGSILTREESWILS
jgi:hypothetical protein